MLELLAETSDLPMDLSNPFVLLMLLAVLAAVFVIFSGLKCGYPCLNPLLCAPREHTAK